MENNIEELYEVLDEMNSRIEEIVNEYSGSESFELVISKLSQKSQEFIYDFQIEIETLEPMGMEV